MGFGRSEEYVPQDCDLDDQGEEVSNNEEEHIEYKREVARQLDLQSLQSQYLRKLNDPREFVLMIKMGDILCGECLIDSGASVNILPSCFYDLFCHLHLTR